MVFIFDMDGTLIDSMPYCVKAVYKVMEEHGVTPTPDIIKNVIALGYDGTARYFIDHLNWPLTVDETVTILKQRMKSFYENTIPAKEHVPQVLDKLLAQGHRLAVLTASPHEMVDTCLTRLGLFDKFEHIWNTDDFGMAKSDVMIYKNVASRFEVSVNDCVFLDDSIMAVQAAKKAGMTVIGVYDKAAEKTKEDMLRTCSKYIYDFNELLS